MKYNHIKKILILVTILAVPGFLYYLLQDKGKNRYKPLPIYGPKQVASTFHSVRGKQIPDTIYHLVDDFVLTNQNGDTTSLNTWKGKVVVLNLFYTQVNSDGAKMSMKAMQGFNEMYQNNHMVHLASISVDSKDDLKASSNFAKSQNAVAQKWDFLIGDTVTLNKVVKRSLLLDAVDNSTQSDRKFLYSNKIVLLDSQHRIRGFYEASNQEALSKLDDEIKVLIAEELRNIKDGR
ncbi:SCO family protein [Pedobacter chitinilyticus]|uniref:Redoxin domain-containing protein n=1 Tax=Pedobacter chitinilyticus TaxID=2233776 RepID=A0A443YPH3_9SPHI|nr:SCO family protein [Pedobacter chitinilyticus]RWU05663.1 redoxin domain-containing protein [Pedobacter chitinilyticus]